MSSSTTEALSLCSLTWRSQSNSSIVDSNTSSVQFETASGERPRTEAGSDPPVSNQRSASSRKRKNYGPSDMIKVFVPVSICMLLVVTCTRNIEIYKGDDIIKTLYVVYHDPKAEAPTKIWHSLVNAGVFLLIVAIATFGIVALFYYKFYRCLNFFVMFSTFMLITLVSLMQYYEILRAINYPLSLPLVLFLHGNLAAVELMSIFWKGPMKAQQGTLILMAAMVTLTIMRIFPKWTSWAVLIALGFWDLFAVLSPCGPLKLLVETAEERGEDLMPAIIYTGSATLPKTDLTQSSVESEPNEQRSSRSRSKGVNSLRAFSIKSSEGDERNIRLGLGDFIFYSLLVGNASVLADWTTTLSCYVAIVMGLGFTLMLLVVFQKALPALPISIAFGAITFFSSKFVTSKFVEEIYRKPVFL
ncbi:unnamed protein product [Cylicocyclus nassatus]|uniref:Presenilin n=1 Tax=Cylicocyclus nassatus TaxID=53992 RepID=A0AA36H6S1_CYLNA|nr:unnamed protein product [Cylicocyclus nassatus]